MQKWSVSVTRPSVSKHVIARRALTESAKTRQQRSSGSEFNDKDLTALGIGFHRHVWNLSAELNFDAP